MTDNKLPLRAVSRTFKNEGFHNSNHSYSMSSLHDNDAIKNPSYWSNCTRGVRAGDFITVRKEDFSYVAILYVTSVEDNVGITTATLNELDFNKDKATIEVTKYSQDDFEIGYVPNHKWRIIEKNTKQILSKNHTTKEDAEKFLENFLQK